MSTLTAYRRAIAPLLGPYYQGSATSGSTTSILEATAAPFKTALDAAAFFEDYFIFRPSASNADKTRIVHLYDPVSGQLTADRVWGTAPSVDETFELHAIVPPYLDGLTDLHFLINEGLKRCPVTVEFTFSTSNATHRRHSLASAASWLTRQRWVRRVGTLPAGQTDRDVYTPHEAQGSTYELGNTVYLAGFSASTTDTVYVTAVKPAYHHCKASAGAFGDQNGLSLETDEAPVPVDWLAQATLLEVWERLGNQIASSDAKQVETELAKAAARYSRLTKQYFKNPPRTFRPHVRFGPAR